MGLLKRDRDEVARGENVWGKRVGNLSGRAEHKHEARHREWHDGRHDDTTGVTREHAAQAGMDNIDGESEGDRRTKNVVAIRGKLILRKLGPRH